MGTISIPLHSKISLSFSSRLFVVFSECKLRTAVFSFSPSNSNCCLNKLSWKTINYCRRSHLILTLFLHFSGSIKAAFSLIMISPCLMSLDETSPYPFPSIWTSLNGLHWLLWLFQADFWHCWLQYWAEPHLAHLRSFSNCLSQNEQESCFILTVLSQSRLFKTVDNESYVSKDISEVKSVRTLKMSLEDTTTVCLSHRRMLGTISNIFAQIILQPKLFTEARA